MSAHANHAMIGLAVLFLGTMMLFLGVVGPKWVDYEQGVKDRLGYYYHYYGLWTKCVQIANRDKECDSTANLDENENWYVAAQALAALGLATAILSMGLLIFWICTHRTSHWLKITTISMIIISSVLCGICCVLFANNGKDYLKDLIKPLYLIGFRSDNITFCWGFYVMIAGCVFVFLSAMFLIPAGRSLKYKGTHPGSSLYSGGSSALAPVSSNQASYSWGNSWVNPYSLQQKVSYPPQVHSQVVQPPVVQARVVQPPVVQTHVVQPPVIETEVVQPPVVQTQVIQQADICQTQPQYLRQPLCQPMYLESSKPMQQIQSCYGNGLSV